MSLPSAGCPPTSSIELLEQLAVHEARENFWAFRRFMRPEMLTGWWVKALSDELELFYVQMLAGMSPFLIVCTPPQHGKSWAVIDFMAWVLGKNPDFRIIFGSFSKRLGIRANLWVQRLMMTERYAKVFPETRLPFRGSGYQRSSEVFELLGAAGYFRNTTVGGPVTGESLDLGVVDDPIKGAAEARSLLKRDTAWTWLTDDFMTRGSSNAGTLLIQTRWHVDDPSGRAQEQITGVRTFSYSALATEEEPYRAIGDPLFPELKNKKFLLARKEAMLDSAWEAVYQQNPYVRGGGLFPVGLFQFADAMPGKLHIRASVRYWDKAGTQDGGCYTAGVLMHLLSDGRYLISDVIRGQWSALNREQHIRQAAEMDGHGVRIVVEQEPGSGGKESAESTIRALAGFIVSADRVTGNKELRAEPYAKQVQGSNVILLRAAWNRAFLSEHEEFPNSKLKDQVDSAAGAFAELTNGGLNWSMITAR